MRTATNPCCIGLLTVLIGAFLAPTHALASMGSPMRVRGEVMAVNVHDTPNVIVIRTTTTKNQELIVGAIVDPDVDITHGSRPVSLRSLKEGDSVVLVYVKTLEGLVARSIHVP